MADVAHEENVIENDERTFIHSIIDFGDTVAREVMAPRPDMVTVEPDTTVHQRARGRAGRRLQPDPGGGGQSTTSWASPTPRISCGPSGSARPPSPCAVRPAGQVRPRVQGRLGPLARNAGGEVPHGHRGRRVRRDGRAGHPRGPDRGAGGRHRRRVRRGGADRRTTRRRLGGGQCPLLPWTTPTSCSAPSCPTGTWDTVGGLMLDLAGPRARPRATRSRSTASASPRSTCGAGASTGCASSRRANRRQRSGNGTERRRPGERRRRRADGRATCARDSWPWWGGPTSASRRWSTRWSAPRCRSRRRGPTPRGTASSGSCTTRGARSSSSTRPGCTGPAARSGRG